MNDARIPTDFVASERARDQEVFRRSAQERAARSAQAVPLGRPRGILTVEQAAARQAQVEGGRLKVEQRRDNSIVPPPTSNLQPRSTFNLQPSASMRLSLAAVLVLIVIWVWIKQGKK